MTDLGSILVISLKLLGSHQTVAEIVGLYEGIEIPRATLTLLLYHSINVVIFLLKQQQLVAVKSGAGRGRWTRVSYNKHITSSFSICVDISKPLAEKWI